MYGYDAPEDPVHQLTDQSPYARPPSASLNPLTRRTLLPSTIARQHQVEASRRKANGFLPMVSAIVFDNATNEVAMNLKLNQIIVGLRSHSDQGASLGDSVRFSKFEVTTAPTFIGGLWYIPSKITEFFVQLEGPDFITIAGSTILTIGPPMPSRPNKATTFRVNLLPDSQANWTAMKLQVHSVPGQ